MKNKLIQKMKRGQYNMEESEVFYQVKLILDTLTKDEYGRIPKDAIDLINKKAKKNTNTSIDVLKPLEDQDIDIKVLEVLNEILELVPEDKIEDKKIETIADDSQYLYTVEKLKAHIKDIENSNLYLKKEIEMLKSQLNSIPKFVKKIFIKDSKYLLSDKK